MTEALLAGGILISLTTSILLVYNNLGTAWRSTAGIANLESQATIAMEDIRFILHQSSLTSIVKSTPNANFDQVHLIDYEHAPNGQPAFHPGTGKLVFADERRVIQVESDPQVAGRMNLALQNLNTGQTRIIARNVTRFTASDWRTDTTLLENEILLNLHLHPLEGHDWEYATASRVLLRNDNLYLLAIEAEACQAVDPRLTDGNPYPAKLTRFEQGVDGGVTFMWVSPGDSQLNWGETNTNRPRLECRLIVPENKSYYLWGRMRSGSNIPTFGYNDAFTIRVNGVLEDTTGWPQTQTYAGHAGWAWRRIPDPEGPMNPYSFDPNGNCAGGCLIKVYMRKDGAQMDRILATDDPDYIPQ